MKSRLVGIVACLFSAGLSLGAGADEPLLRFGVVSDIHVTAADDGTLKRSDNLDLFLGALRYFDRMKADAVVVAIGRRILPVDHHFLEVVASVLEREGFLCHFLFVGMVRSSLRIE